MRSSRVVLAFAVLCWIAGGQSPLTVRDDEGSLVGFVDISTTGGTPLPGVTSSSSHAIVSTIGNTLFPAGDVLISARGVAIAGLTSGIASFTSTFIPEVSGIPAGLPPGGKGYALVYWGDLEVFAASADTTIWWQELNGVLIIMWKGIGYVPGVPGQDITFELQVFDQALDCGTSFQFLYPDTEFGGTQQSLDFGSTATIGYCSALANGRHSFHSSNAVPSGATVTIHPSISDALDFASPLGPTSLRVQFITCTTTTYLFAVTLHAGNYPNGWLFGLDIPVSELVAQIALGQPFVGTSTGLPDFHTFGPFMGVPPVTFYAIVLGFKGGVLVGHSDAIAYTVP